MPLLIIEEFMGRLEQNLEGLQELLKTSLDFAGLEQAINASLDAVGASLLAFLLQRLLQDSSYLARLKQLAARLGMRFKEYRLVRLRLRNGQWIEVWAPYFLKAAPQRRRKGKRRGDGVRGASLGLDVLGFSGRVSALLLSDVVQLAVLCPSLAVAQAVLARRGIDIDVKTLRRFCRELGEGGVAQRGRVSLAGPVELAGYTVVIGIDGGRLRERRRKRGRKPAGQQRQGYHTDWKEPKLFTIYVLEAEGKVVKDIDPWHDATRADHAGLFAILEQYLRALDLSAVAQVVFCGDGAPWIWSGVEALCDRLGLDRDRLYQVLDYTHAKQNLQTILDLVPPAVRQQHALDRRWKERLWQGDLAGLREAIEQTITAKTARQQALKKWQNYFEGHAQRMQYQHFRARHIPCGSGCVESAIRRVINLRLKAPGTFWTRDMAECFLFLRAQLLSGRWDIMLDNITRQTATLLEKRDDSPVPAPSYPMLQAA